MGETQDGIPKLGTVTCIWSTMDWPPMVYTIGAIQARARRLGGYGVGVWGPLATWLWLYGHQLYGYQLFTIGYWLVAMAMAIGYMDISFMGIGFWLLVMGIWLWLLTI